MGRKQPTEEQRQAAAERREAFKALSKRVAAMPPDQREALLARFGAVVTCAGRALSPFNSISLLMQRDTVSMVGGFQQWREAGRKVRKGARGLAIWIPAMKGGEPLPEGAEPADGEKSERKRFLIGYVFDVADTQEADAVEVEPAEALAAC